MFGTAPGASNIDTVLDFTVEEDAIELDLAVFSAFNVGTLKGKFFHIGKNAGDQNDFLIYNEKNGKLYYDPDGKGGDKQVQFATLDKHLAHPRRFPDRLTRRRPAAGQCHVSAKPRRQAFPEIALATPRRRELPGASPPSGLPPGPGARRGS